MEEVLRFIKNLEIFVYVIFGGVAIWQTRKFTLAWEELRNAAFGLERESAQSKLNWSASLIVFAIGVAILEFAAVSFIVPTIPGGLPLFTPTVDLLATPTITLPAAGSENQTALVGSPEPTLVTESSGCIPGKLLITSPVDGESVSGLVEIFGTADIENFGFYKFEMAYVGDTSWLTIQAGDTITHEGKLGRWDTTRLEPGEYGLQLVATDNEGISAVPCIIKVFVTAP